MQKKNLFLLLLVSLLLPKLFATDTISIKQPQIPILIDRTDNILFYMRIDAKQSDVLTEVKMHFDETTKIDEIQSIKLYYGGTEAIQNREKALFAPVNYISSHNPNNTRSANPSYSIKIEEVDNLENDIVFSPKYPLVRGINYFWISIEMKSDASLLSKIKASFISAKLDSRKASVSITNKDITRRLAVGVRHAGDDDIPAYRIPGLATTNKGTLLAVYDVRYNNSVDLQEHIDVGLSRSIDGGQSWQKMRIPMRFGEYGGLPAAQNGAGDPSILADTQTGTIWIAALWTHGMGNSRAWHNSQAGSSIEKTGQLMLTKSRDDGQTWSLPINITKQVKRPSWRLLLQGPGRGITMCDGTLVFPIQFIDSLRMPHAGIMFSKDKGETWKIHNPARNNTTEAQIAEIKPGVLMLNMRDNRGGSRAISITKDLGKTWTEHPSNRSELQGSVCMASLLHIEAKENVMKRDLLLFSNPNTKKGRHHITIKGSVDGGISFPKKHQILLDEDNGWGYSCLTMIDSETIGILYESSVAHITFQAIKLNDIFGKNQ